MRRILVLTASILLLASCGGDDEAKPVDKAHEYAIEKSGGTTTGCSNAASGAEAENNPGCIYSVSLAGCTEGLTGESPNPLPIEQEFAQEPGLVERYHQAVTDCTE
jgi:hypothetical protein